MGCKFTYKGITYDSQADLLLAIKQNIGKTEDTDVYHNVTKVISGAQTGVDIAGLDAAQEVGIETGGTAAAYFQQSTTGDAKIYNPGLAEKYGVKEGKITMREGKYGTYEDVYYQRTIDNAQEADGTIWFGNKDSPGGKLTLGNIAQKGKPAPLINPKSEQEILNWLVKNNIKVLNVAGNREHTNPGIYDKAKNLLVKALSKKNTNQSTQQVNNIQEIKPKGTINVYWGQAETENSTKLLSNLAPRKFKYKSVDGITREYGSVEHAYQSLKSGNFDQATYDSYERAGGYGVKIRGKQANTNISLQLMEDLVLESFKQNPNSEAVQKLLQYENFTHNTNEVIDKAFLRGLKTAQKYLLSQSQTSTPLPQQQSKVETSQERETRLINKFIQKFNTLYPEITMHEVDSIEEEESDNILNQRADETIKEGVSELFESNPELANAVYEALGFGQERSVLESISLSDDGYHSLLSKLLLEKNELFNNRNVTLDSKLVKQITKNDNSLGVTWMDNIYVSNNDVKLFLHEYIHKFTNEVFINYKSGVKLKDYEQRFISEIQRLYDKSHKIVTNNTRVGVDGKYYYGLTNIEEFVSEGITDNEFIKYLSTIKDDSNKTFFDNLINTIKGFINKVFNNQNTVSESVFNSFFDYYINKEKTLALKGEEIRKIKREQYLKQRGEKETEYKQTISYLTSQQKQQAQQIYSQYLEQGGKDIEGFKEFVDGKNNLLAQESELNNTVDNQNIQNQKTKQGKIIGQARINELEILIDKNSKNPEVIAHEYAHFYIRRFLNTPIVQEAIAKWGTEEALVQAIGEQAVRQEGDAWNWWVAFSRWIKNLFNKLSDLDRKDLRNILTDAFLTNQDLNAIDYGDSASLTTVEQRFPTDREISTELKDQIEKGIVLVPRRTAEGKVENDLYRFDSSKGSWGNYDGEIDIELSPESFVKEYNKNSDPSWRVNTEAALYNRLLELHKRNALHPKNAHNLVTPIDTHNTDKIVKAKGLSMKYPNSSAVIDPAINLRNAEYFLHAKSAVGIQADQISALALLKAANVASLPSIKSEVSGKQIPIFLAPFKVPTIRKNGKDVYTFARMFDTEGNLISNTVSEVLTLDVDAVKNPVIVKMGFNLKTSNLGSTLLAYGVPLDLVENFLEEDDTSVITRWQREIDKNENIYHKGKKLPAERSNYNDEWLDAKTVEKSNSKLKEEFMEAVKAAYPQSAAEAQGILNFFPYDKSTKTSAHFTLNYNHPTVQGDPTILIRNPVLKLAYFWDLIEISKEYTNVVRALKPDSKPHRSIAEAKIQRELVDKVASGESIISAEDAAKIIPRKNTKSMSVISSFFEAQKFYEKLFSKFFYIEKYGLSDLLLEKIETGYAQSKDMLTKTVTRAQNDFRLKLLYDTYGMNPYAQQVLPAGDDKRPMSPDRIFNGAPSMINKIYSSLQSIKAGTPSTDSMFANVSSGMAERLLNTLFFELNRHERQLDGYTDLIKLAERTATTAGINNTIELFEDVRTFSPELYKMFTAITLYQAGLNNSPYSLIKVMPNDNVDFANNSILSALSHATKIFDAMIGYIEKVKGATAAKQAVDQYVSDFMDWFTVEHGAMVAPLETKSRYMEAALGYRAYNSTKGIYDYYNKNRTYITPTSKFVVDYSAYYAENENRVSKASRETVKLLGADEQAQIQVLENAGFDVKQICEGS